VEDVQADQEIAIVSETLSPSSVTFSLLKFLMEMRTMLRRLRSVLPILLTVVGIVGCQAPSEWDGMPNSITGKVILRDTNADTVFADHSGVIVSILGTSFTTTTNNAGQYTFSTVPPGIYLLQFTKTGFDTLLIDQVEYSGVGVEFLRDRTMHSLSQGLLTLDTILITRAIDHPEIDSVSIQTIVLQEDTTIIRADTTRIPARRVLVSIDSSVDPPDSVYEDRAEVITIHRDTLITPLMTRIDTSVYILGSRFALNDTIVSITGTAQNVPNDQIRLEFRGGPSSREDQPLTEFRPVWRATRFTALLPLAWFTGHYYMWPNGQMLEVQARVAVAEYTQMVRSATRILNLP
jgi:hypothetical protein